MFFGIEHLAPFGIHDFCNKTRREKQMPLGAGNFRMARGAGHPPDINVAKQGFNQVQTLQAVLGQWNPIRLLTSKQIEHSFSSTSIVSFVFFMAPPVVSSSHGLFAEAIPIPISKGF